MSDLFKALVVHSVPVTHDGLTAPVIVACILAAFVIVTTVAAIVYAERQPRRNAPDVLSFSDMVIDALATKGISPSELTGSEWQRIYDHYFIGDVTPQQTAKMIANAKRRPSNDNTKG